jgi:23S rRNA (uracil1939-C5)-methyltransferase
MISSSPPIWQQGSLLDLSIDRLADSGDGVGRWQDRVVFVPDSAVGDRLRVRLLHVRSHYARAQLVDILSASAQRIRPACIVADKCGGCQWQHIDYAAQLEAKRQVVRDALVRLGGFTAVVVEPVLPCPQSLNYRNKATYPLGRSPQGQVQAGYFRKGSHRLVNLNRCPVQDERLDPLLAEVKHDIQARGWPIYDETYHRGQLRHLALRIGRRTGEQLLTLVSATSQLPALEEQAHEWLRRYPALVGVCLNLNPARGNAIFGLETRCLAGQDWLEERFANLRLRIRPETFFQVNTEQAEAMIPLLQEGLDLQGSELLLDAYCGIGTLTLPLAPLVQRAIGIEVQPEAVQQAEENARLNHLENVTFQVGAVEALLEHVLDRPDVVLLDPPRRGCDRQVLEALLQLKPRRIAYVSCKPASLARDLKVLCGEGQYRLDRIQPVDLFPQTPHVETLAFLTAVNLGE